MCNAHCACELCKLVFFLKFFNKPGTSQKISTNSKTSQQLYFASHATLPFSILFHAIPSTPLIDGRATA